MEVYEKILLAVCYVSLCLLVILLCFAAVSYSIGVVVMAIKHFREKARGVRGAAAMQGWIPVTKRLPKNNSDVLACRPGDYLTPIVFPANFSRCGMKPIWWDLASNAQAYAVTHWMPMPLPPEGD